MLFELALSKTTFPDDKILQHYNHMNKSVVLWNVKSAGILRAILMFRNRI
jgi:hypothetical protein